MRRFLLTGCIVFLLINKSNSQSGLEAYWDDGLKFRSRDDKFKFSAGGRVHMDAAFLGQSGALDTLTGKAFDNVSVRRARLSFEGTINNRLAYEVEFDLGKTIEYADMYLAFLNVPFINRVTIGYFREPFGMEQVTSSNSTVFMERSLPGTFGRPRNTGIMMRQTFLKDRLTGYAGFFRITNDLGSDEEAAGKHSFSSRWAFTPVFDTSTNETLHLGAGVNMYSPQQQTHEVSTQNESDLSPLYINTGSIPNVKKVNQLGGELGFTKNRLCIMAEYIHSFARLTKDTARQINKNSIGFSSFYTTASYFLSGAKRTYNTNRNAFSSIDISKDNGGESWKGAWEIGLRLSHINIADAGAAINKLTDITVGINRYFNSNTRLMMNYVFSMLNKGYTANALQFRMQVTF